MLDTQLEMAVLSGLNDFESNGQTAYKKSNTIVILRKFISVRFLLIGRNASKFEWFEATPLNAVRRLNFIRVWTLKSWNLWNSKRLLKRGHRVVRFVCLRAQVLQEPWYLRFLRDSNWASRGLGSQNVWVKRHSLPGLGLKFVILKFEDLEHQGSL